MEKTNEAQAKKLQILKNHDYGHSYINGVLLFEEISHNNKTNQIQSEWVDITGYSVKKLTEYLGY